EVHIIVEPEAVKNDVPLDFPLPPAITALLETYLAKFRPRLATPGCTALFPGRKGGSKSLNGLRDQICKAIRRRTGIEMHPHLFRHAAAKLFLETHPGDYEEVRRILGHRSIATTIKFYTPLETAAAVRRYDEIILKLWERAKTNEQDPASQSRPAL